MKFDKAIPITAVTGMILGGLSIFWIILPILTPTATVVVGFFVLLLCFFGAMVITSVIKEP